MLGSAADHVRSIASHMEGMHSGVQRWSLVPSWGRLPSGPTNLSPGAIGERRLSRLCQWDVPREHP
jgi:hypothetical protein